jgi:hypothetical protein
MSTGDLTPFFCLERKTYAVEVKSGRRRNTQGLSKFISRYPDSIPVMIDNKNAETLLRATDVGALFHEGKIF